MGGKGKGKGKVVPATSGGDDEISQFIAQWGLWKEKQNNKPNKNKWTLQNEYLKNNWKSNQVAQCGLDGGCEEMLRKASPSIQQQAMQDFKPPAHIQNVNGRFHKNYIKRKMKNLFII